MSRITGPSCNAMAHFAAATSSASEVSRFCTETTWNPLLLSPLVELGALYWLVFFFGGIPACFALNPQELMSQFTHTSWTAKEGIPGPVRAIAQTKDGYLWRQA